MHLKKLSEQFYKDNYNLQEALDNINGSWINGKTRGYGVVLIELNDLTFAIPLRTRVNHKACFVTKKSAPFRKGLDYSKALLISKPEYVTNDSFIIPSDEHRLLIDKSYIITKEFSKYVEKYIKAVNRKDIKLLDNVSYRYTTLINYHKELGIE